MTNLLRRPAILLLCALPVCPFGFSACSSRKDSGPVAASDGNQQTSPADRQNRARRLNVRFQELLKRSRSAEVLSQGKQEPDDGRPVPAPPASLTDPADPSVVCRCTLFS